MSATSNWAPAHNVVVTAGGVTVPCTDGSLDIDISEFETTNTTSPLSLGGQVFYEGGQDSAKVTINFTFPWDLASPPAAISYGSRVAISYTGSDGVAHSGQGRISKVGKPISAKGAFLTKMSATFVGSVTNI